VQWDLPKVTRRLISADRVEPELERLRDAIRSVKKALTGLRDQARARVGPEEAKIFDAQILMLEDPDLLSDIESLVRDNQLSPERAFEFRTLELTALWSQSASLPLRQRVADMSGIQKRVLNHLTGRSIESIMQADDARPVVVFTRELSPDLMVQLEQGPVAGFASEEGTRTAHAAILARSLGVPCVMGLVGSLERVKPGTEVMLDGNAGTILLEPTQAELDDAQETQRVREALERHIASSDDGAVVTKDGERMTLLVNVDLPDDLERASHHGAEGVGLLRTEFLLLGRAAMPTEDEQAGFFERAVQRFEGHPVVIRSYDIGGDKYPMSFEGGAEANPSLGWRAIRVCLDNPDLFRTQVRALMRARRHGDLQLMLPLVTALEEITQARAIIAEAACQLADEGVAAATDLPVGVMIETPAAALLADRIAEMADFLSVGSNDLTQYTLAVDRGNARLASRFTHFHPAVIKLLKDIVDVGTKWNKPPSVCGEMASDPVSVFLLVGLGYRVLSAAGPSIPILRWFIRQIDAGRAREVVNEVLTMGTADEIRAHIEQAVGEKVGQGLVGAGQLPHTNRATTLNEPE
jgi:phosphotransferase system enzyme I (PtsI)